MARQEFLIRILKGAAFVVAITVAVMLNRYFMMILLVSFIIGVSALVEDFAARPNASPNIFDPINGLVLLACVAYVVAVERILYPVFRPEKLYCAEAIAASRSVRSEHPLGHKSSRRAKFARAFSGAPVIKNNSP